MRYPIIIITVLFMIICVLLIPESIAQQKRNVRPIQSEMTDTDMYQTIRYGMGKTWAVLIANSNYSDWPNLKGFPYKDIERIENALANYEIDKIIIKKDVQMEEFQPYLNSLYDDLVKEKVQSLFIYFAGHGEYDERLDKGYWIPIDAKVSQSKLGYLSDTDIRGFIELFNRRVNHVLLLADCCFSGSILDFRAKQDNQPTQADFQNLKVDVSKKSSFGITSGRKEETVLNQSKFALAFEDILVRKKEKYLRTDDIAYQLSKMVRETLRNQQPQSGPITQSHEFGQFIFIKRNQSIMESEKFQASSPSTSDLANTLGIEFILIHGATFDMGDLWGDGEKKELPVHNVTLSDYFMSKYEITNKQFCIFLNEMGNQMEGGVPWINLSLSEIQQNNSTFEPKIGFENHPVVSVTWHGAKRFAEWMTGRLPTEAEWEYAARGGGGNTKYPNGDNLANRDANFSGIGGQDKWTRTSPIGMFDANAIGLYDMAGNVWEWCEDWQGSYSSAPQMNPTGPASGSSRIVRGGAFDFDQSYCRTSYRFQQWPSSTGLSIGFRIVRSAN